MFYNSVGPSSTVHITIPKTISATVRKPEPRPATLPSDSRVVGAPDPPKSKINALTRFSLLGQGDKLQEHALGQKPLLGRIAMSGEATVWFAPPNSGKTLIAFSLIFAAISANLIDPEKVFYLNLDDSSAGLAAKVAIAEDYRFQMISQGHNGFTPNRLAPAMLEMIEKDEARGTLIVVDTIKKFTDVMDKRSVSAFNECVRQFVLKGGTFLALAHTNKRTGADGKRVYAGTSDILDDFDAAYMLGEKAINAVSRERTVEFECIKKRGGGDDHALYTYSIEHDLDYQHRVSSVRDVDPQDDPRFGGGPSEPSETIIIGHAEDCLNWKPLAKMVFRDILAKKAQVSHRTALGIIEKYTGADPDRHKWNFTVKARGAKLYELLQPVCALPTGC